MVTGASSGIGAACARDLAERGVDLVVVARDLDRLEALAAELADRHGVTVDPLAADLSSPISRTPVENLLLDTDRPVDLLVNNAGFGTSGRFSDLPVAREDQEIQLNVLALMRLTRAALPGMIERGSGNVLNISSVAGLFPSPGSATYAATKAFVLSLSDALHEELRGTGVCVTASLPGLTRTEFHERSRSTVQAPEFAWGSAETVAAASLDAAAAGRARVVPGSMNKALATAMSGMPAALRRRVVGGARQRLSR